MVFIQEIIYHKQRYIDEFKSTETHWIALYKNTENVTYFESFGVKHIPKEIIKFIGNKILKQIYEEYKHKIQ